MKEDEMIQQLQDRFGLSKNKAIVIYFYFEKYFTINRKIIKENSSELLEVP